MGPRRCSGSAAMLPRVESSYVGLLCGVEAGLPCPVPAGLLFRLLLLRLPLAAISVAARRALLGRRGIRTAPAACIRLCRGGRAPDLRLESALPDRKSTRLNSSHLGISYA